MADEVQCRLAATAQLPGPGTKTDRADLLWNYDKESSKKKKKVKLTLGIRRRKNWKQDPASAIQVQEHLWLKNPKTRTVRSCKNDCLNWFTTSVYTGHHQQQHPELTPAACSIHCLSDAPALHTEQ